MRKTIRIIALTTTLLIQWSSIHALSRASHASLAASAVTSATIVQGSVQILRAGVRMSVASVELVGQIAYITLHSASRAGQIVIKVSAEAITAIGQSSWDASRSITGYSSQEEREDDEPYISLSSGNIVDVIATSAGNMLVASGYIIAFIPTTVGKSLIHNASH